MAKQDRLEKVAKKAIAEAEKAIAAAVTAAKDLGKATRKNAAALVARLEDGIAEVTGAPANGATADKAKDAEKATKAEKVKAEKVKKAKKSDKAKTEKPAAQTTTKAATKAAAAAVKAKAPTVRSKTAAPATTTEPTVAQLRAQSKAAGLSGYSRLTRAELVALLAGGKDK